MYLVFWQGGVTLGSLSPNIGTLSNTNMCCCLQPSKSHHCTALTPHPTIIAIPRPISPAPSVSHIYWVCKKCYSAKLWSKIFSSHAFVNDMFLKWVPWTGDKCTKTSLWLWSPTQKYTFSQFGFRGSVGRIERVRSKLPNGKQRFEVKVDTHKHTSTRAHGLWTQDTRPHHVLCGVKQSVTQCTIWDCQLAVMLCHN